VDLLAAVEAGTFRRDFYHRLAWHTILIPPLRDRRSDIPALVRSFVRGCGQGTDWGIAGISKEVQYLADLPWSGNVRELKAVVQAAGAVASYFITLGDICEVLRRNEGALHSGHGGAADKGTMSGSAAIQADDAGRTRHEELTYDAVPYRAMMERYFAYLYGKCDGNLPELARLAGIAKATAYEWKGKYGKDL
jgi:DNA-binding NtrC family response regulator